MKTKVMAILVVALFGACVAPSSGTIIGNHEGNLDPVTEGWTLNPGTNFSVGPLTGDMGHDAWFTNDHGQNLGDNGGYGITLTSDQTASLHAAGWKMSALVRVPTESQHGMSVAYWFTDDTTRFGFSLVRDSAGNNSVTLWAPGYGGWSPTWLYPVADGYRLYEFVSNGTSASFYIDGELKVSDYTGDGYNETTSSISFGSGTSYGFGQGNWAMVKFEQIPEPMTLSLLALGGLALRRRKA